MYDQFSLDKVLLFRSEWRHNLVPQLFFHTYNMIWEVGVTLSQGRLLCQFSLPPSGEIAFSNNSPQISLVGHAAVLSCFFFFKLAGLTFFHLQNLSRFSTLEGKDCCPSEKVPNTFILFVSFQVLILLLQVWVSDHSLLKSILFTGPSHISLYLWNDQAPK